MYHYDNKTHLQYLIPRQGVFQSNCFLGFVLLGLFGLSACSTLPMAGPSARAVVNANQLTKVSEHTVQETAAQNQQDAFRAFLVEVTPAVSDTLAQRYQKALFSEVWGDSSTADQRLGVGDVIDLTIWEAPPALLFGGSLGSAGVGSGQVTQLPSQVVDQSGMVNVPFVGSVKAEGKSLRQIEQDVIKRLRDKANQPQVIASLAKNNSSNVTVIREGSTVTMPLTVKGERVLDAISAIGGVSQAANKTAIQLTRGGQVSSLPLSLITQDPRQNIRLKAGDVVTANFQPLSFTALGASGKNEEVSFEGQGISLAQALGRMGGLNDDRANPNGVFIFRYEDAANISQSDVTRFKLKQKIPVVYRINFKDPSMFFYAQKFPIQDKDVIYVANAPVSDLQKFLRIMFSFVVPITSTINLVQ